MRWYRISSCPQVLIDHSILYCTCIHADLNECEDGADSCDVNAECTNTDGSYTCSCTSGYSGDGFMCNGAANIANLSCHVMSWCLFSRH